MHFLQARPHHQHLLCGRVACNQGPGALLCQQVRKHTSSCTVCTFADSYGCGAICGHTTHMTTTLCGTNYQCQCSSSVTLPVGLQVGSHRVVFDLL